MNRVGHFGIHAADPERAAKFYRDVFGWDINEWVVPGVGIPKENRYWPVTTGSEKEPGIKRTIATVRLRRVRPSERGASRSRQIGN